MIVSMGRKKAKYIVHFDHNPWGKRGMISQTRIMAFGNREPITAGIHKVSKANLVTRALRRTRSFADALANSTFNRAERMKFMNAYNAQCNRTLKREHVQA
jgi:hypothetical protein